MNEQADIRKAHCNCCMGSKSHHLINEYEEKEREVIAEDEHGEHSISTLERFELLKCCGCGQLTVRQTLWCSEWNSESEARYYPPTRSRRLPEWIEGRTFDEHVLWPDHFVPRLLKQVYTALFDSCLALAAMGIRALLEQVMIDTVGDQGSFKRNLEKFESEGYVSAKSRAFFETVLELGHAAIHRKFDPSSADVLRALDIAEGILALVYWHGKQAEELQKRVPPRSP